MTRLELLEIAKPIPFNDEMVRAILNNEKSVTRRPIKVNTVFPKALKPVKNPVGLMTVGGIIRPQYQVGDYLYVRETWTELETVYDNLYYAYKADDDTLHHSIGENFTHWRPSTRMPKEAARIFLQVTGVRVERLQDITEDGVCEEGAEPLIQCPNERTIYYPDGGMEACYNTSCCKPCYFDKPYSELFGKLVWNSTVKKSDLAKYGWDANPWVWVIEFEKVEVTE